MSKASDRREQRYIDAILDAYNETYCEGLDRRAGPAEMAGAKIYARAAIAVADAENAALRAEVEQLRKRAAAWA